MKIDWYASEGPIYSERPLYSPECPCCGDTLQEHYDAMNDRYFCDDPANQ